MSPPTSRSETGMCWGNSGVYKCFGGIIELFIIRINLKNLSTFWTPVISVEIIFKFFTTTIAS